MPNHFQSDAVDGEHSDTSKKDGDSKDDDGINKAAERSERRKQ